MNLNVDMISLGYLGEFTCDFSFCFYFLITKRLHCYLFLIFKDLYTRKH